MGCVGILRADERLSEPAAAILSSLEHEGAIRRAHSSNLPPFKLGRGHILHVLYGK